ncbi:MAG: thioredoxin domain-containing protein [Acidobacteriota bacterium]
MPNHLAFEKSPYLLQHKDNPVDWYPWGDEAFARARAEARPIFLSVGYSTCHWCHVMEHESFEDAQVAALLNRDFVPIKVDREERPDVDRIYMTFVQATTGSGGWPMSVWLTPNLKPFYGGTYFPPRSRGGRPGLVDVLADIARVWREDRDQVRQSADGLAGRLANLAQPGPCGEVPGPGVLASGVAELAAVFDRRHGGFGDAPKFPRPSELLFLLREHARTGNEQARDMALQTLQAMAFGGMRDHIGGGFHRYSVDAEWRVPHFEKMLYDQAQLVLAYLEASQVTGERSYRDVAEDTIRYVLRDMTGPDGGFYSAEDADSVPPEDALTPGAPKSEGAFYAWTSDEIAALVGDDADLVRRRFGIEPGGNAPFDPHGEFGSKNLLYVARSVPSLAEQFGLDARVVAERLVQARRVMFDARSSRPRPHLDDKVLAAWNGLMIAALARASRVCWSVEYLHAARRAAGFLRSRLWKRESRVLSRRYRAGDVAIDGYADDYAYVIWGALELFTADGDPGWLEWAIDLQRRQDELFWDADAGGWFSTTGTDRSVLVRLKDDYDGAEPAASSIGVMNLQMLAHLTGDRAWHERIESTLGAFADRMTRMGRSVPMMLAALCAHHAGQQQIVLIGPRGDAELGGLASVAAARYTPFAVHLIVEPGAHQAALAALVPALAGLSMRDGVPTAYVCRDFACLGPVTTPEDLRAAI